MDVVDLGFVTEGVREQAARMLVEEFGAPGGWPSLEAARAEVVDILGKGFARGMVDGEMLVGWIGGLPEYDGRVWELHPLVVRRGQRLKGIGRALVEAFEAEASRRGALTFTLGTDDDAGMTSLAGVNLYEDVAGHIRRLRDLGRGHPFLFYRKMGYVVTGVMPDANGPGLPDIYMSKSARRGEGENRSTDLGNGLKG